MQRTAAQYVCNSILAAMGAALNAAIAARTTAAAARAAHGVARRPASMAVLSNVAGSLASAEASTLPYCAVVQTCGQLLIQN